MKELLKFIFISILLILAIFLYDRYSPRKKRLERSKCFTHTREFRYYVDADGINSMLYHFEINGEEYSGVSSLYDNEFQKNLQDTLKILTIQYECKNPKNNRPIFEEMKKKR